MNEAVTVESILDRHVGLMKKFAYQYTTPKWGVDDLIQEAKIALWREAEKRPGDNLEKIASYVIKRRITKLVFGHIERGEATEGAAFGARQAGERSYSVRNTSSLEAAADRLAGLVGSGNALDIILGASPSAEDEYVQAETVQRVQAAVDALPDRLRVVSLGKLEQRSDSETAAELGVTKAMVSHVWRKQARPALAEALG